METRSKAGLPLTLGIQGMLFLIGERRKSFQKMKEVLNFVLFCCRLMTFLLLKNKDACSRLKSQAQALGLEGVRPS